MSRLDRLPLGFGWPEKSLRLYREANTPDSLVPIWEVLQVMRRDDHNASVKDGRAEQFVEQLCRSIIFNDLADVDLSFLTPEEAVPFDGAFLRARQEADRFDYIANALIKLKHLKTWCDRHAFELPSHLRSNFKKTVEEREISSMQPRIGRPPQQGADEFWIEAARVIYIGKQGTPSHKQDDFVEAMLDWSNTNMKQPYSNEAVEKKIKKLWRALGLGRSGR